MNSKYLVRGGCLLTLGPRTPNFAEGDVLFEDGRIVDIGPGLRSRNAETIDASGTIVMPGFVDTHRHAWRSLFRNFNSGGVGTPRATAAVYGPHYGPDDIYAGTLAGLLGAVESGITTVVDWVDVGGGKDTRDAALQAHADSGARTVFVDSSPTWGDDLDHLNMLRSLVESAAAGTSTYLAAGMPDPETSVGESDMAGWTLARELGLRIHAHVGGDSEQRGVVAALADAGHLGSDVTLVHCSGLAGTDLNAIASAGAGVVLTPSSEMAGGLGMPPIQELIDRGIRPGLGVDDEDITPGDMFAQMRITNSVQHATVFDQKLSGKAGLPTILSTREIIKYATFDGAAAVGLSQLTGSLEVGKRADLVILRADRPNIAPINDPIGAVVWGMDTSNVDWVIVDGKVLMAHGDLQTDMGPVRAQVVEAQSRVADASGLATLTRGSA